MLEKAADTRRIQTIHTALFDELVETARNSDRRRTNHNFHPTLEDNPHRFLNVMMRDTYITPHRHQFPPKSESFVLLSGKLAFFIFDDDGSIREMHELNAAGPTIGIDIAPGEWHSVVVLSEYAVCFEVKPGPYQVADDKEFASWAPLESKIKAGQSADLDAARNDADIRTYMDELLRHFDSHNTGR